jgi:hypothetical protein
VRFVVLALVEDGIDVGFGAGVNAFNMSTIRDMWLIER